jgi:hypothetical protein
MLPGKRVEGIEESPGKAEGSWRNRGGAGGDLHWQAHHLQFDNHY